MISRRYKTWLLAALAVAATVSALATFLDGHGLDRIVEAETRANDRAIPTWFAAVRPDHGERLYGLRQEPSPTLRQHPVQADIAAELKRLLVTQPSILQVGLLTTSGRTLFSTDPQRIGHVQTDSREFLSARNGQAASRLTRAGASPDEERDVVTSLIPLDFDGLAPGHGGAQPELIVEVRSDVSDDVNRHRIWLAWFTAIATLVLTLAASTVVHQGHRAARRAHRAEIARQTQHEAVQRESLRDTLTGLPNRAALGDWITHAPTHGANTLFCIDLDRFKLINDTLGQAIGDRVLVHAARRAAAAAGEDVTVYRLGSDEFVAVAPRLCPDRAGELARRIVDAFGEPLDISGEEIAITVSVGFAQWPGDHENLEQVLRCADLAMVAAKQAEARRWASFHPDMREAADHLVSLMNGLRRARDHQQFALHYQPRLNSRTLEIVCVEALLRWNHPDDGLLPPGHFIEALENSPLIVDVGRWVLETACAQAMRWHREGLTGLSMSVNVAARQFNDETFPETVAAALARTGLPPALLELELTESQLIHHADPSRQRIEQLKALGVKVSIDDFGTGYSSLSYLQRLPIDCLKIDRSFIREVGHSRDGQSDEQGDEQSDDHGEGQIARAIAGLAQGLGLAVVAEGIETEAQEKAARLWGCEQVQGFRYSPPVSAGEIPALVRDRHRLANEPALA